MATTNYQLIEDALKLLGVVGEAETMSAEQGADGLRVLNHLMADWEQDGVDLEYFEQTALSDQTPVPDHAILAIKYYVAMALAPDYSRQVPPEFVSLGNKYYSRLIRDAVVNELRPVNMDHLPLGERATADYDITTGNFS